MLGVNRKAHHSNRRRGVENVIGKAATSIRLRRRGCGEDEARGVRNRAGTRRQPRLGSCGEISCKHQQALRTVLIAAGASH